MTHEVTDGQTRVIAGRCRGSGGALTVQSTSGSTPLRVASAGLAGQRSDSMYEHSTARLAMLAAAALLASACGGSSSSDPQAPARHRVVHRIAGLGRPGRRVDAVVERHGRDLAHDRSGRRNGDRDERPDQPGRDHDLHPDGDERRGQHALRPGHGDGRRRARRCSRSPVPGRDAGATSPTRYSGSGIGIWRYHNGTAAPVILDVGIEVGRSHRGPEAGAALLEREREPRDRSPRPSSPTEVLLRAALRSDADLERDARGREHWETTERNRRKASASSGR